MTADYYGVNAGHANPQSNWQMWLDRLEVNSFRLFLAPRNDLRAAVGDSFGKSLSGVVVSSLNQFDAAIAELRTPAGHNPNAKWANPIQWGIYEGGLSGNKGPLGNPNKIVSVCNAKGIQVQAQISISCTGTTRFQLLEFSDQMPAYWQERWALYQWVYGISRWMWVRQIKHIELYNEPDIDSSCKAPEVYSQQLQIRARAVRDAYADLNSEAAPAQRLDLSLGAPSTANILFPNSLGQLAVEQIHTQYGNGTSPDWRNFDDFTYHFYGGPGYNVEYFYKELKMNVQNLVPGLPVSVTEYNNYYGRRFELTNNTMDSPEEAAAFGDITAYLLFNTKRQFVFKFSQTISVNPGNPSGILKDGLLTAENEVAPYNIGDSTRTFEVYQTISQHCKGKQLFDIASPDFFQSNLTAWAVQDNGNWQLYTVNATPDDRNITVDLSGWSVAVGATVLINEISGRYMNQIASIQIMSASKIVTFFTPKSSVMMLTIPIAKVPQMVASSATETAMVTAGGTQNQNYEGSMLKVRLSPGVIHDDTAVSYLKFAVGVSAVSITGAYLELNVIATGSVQSDLLILATSPSWTESTVRWNNAPNLMPLGNGAEVARISDNPIRYGTSPPAVAGHLTIPATAMGVQRVDVTSYLKNSGAATVSFQISRIIRFNKNKVAQGDILGDNSVTFASRTAAPEIAPKLVIFYN